MSFPKIYIIGAGPAGCAAALTLAKENIPFTIIDKALFPRDKICGDALSGKVVEVLKKIDPSLVEKIYQKKEYLHSWGVTFVAPNLNSLRIPFKSAFDKTASPPPGYISRRWDFDNFMLNAVREGTETAIVEGVDIVKYERVNGQWLLEDKSGKWQASADILIIANGAHSTFVRQHTDIEVEPEHYCAGIRAYYKDVEGLDVDNFIELHFLKDFLPGYFWIFPLPGGYANVGVGMRSDAVASQKINLKKSLQEIIKIYPHIRERFKNATLEGDIKGFGLPLGSKKRKLSGEGYMLTGDAASLIDPFTGEGIGNAMMSGHLAALQAIKALERKNYSAVALSKYDEKIYARLWDELRLSRRMQQLVKYPWLFNLVVNKASKSNTLRETISCMFEDLDMRNRLKDPGFYFKLLFNR